MSLVALDAELWGAVADAFEETRRSSALLFATLALLWPALAWSTVAVIAGS